MIVFALYTLDALFAFALSPYEDRPECVHPSTASVVYAELNDDKRFDRLFGHWYSYRESSGERRNRHHESLAVFDPGGSAIVSIRSSRIEGSWKRRDRSDGTSEITINGIRVFSIAFTDLDVITVSSSEAECTLYRKFAWFHSSLPGEIEERSLEDSSLLQRGRILNGKKDGIWETWSMAGGRESTEAFSAGIRNGAFSTWHPNGNTFEFGSYSNGRRHGEWCVWDDNGIPIGRLKYVDGTAMDGTYLEWHHVGVKLKAVGNLRDGKRVGTWTFYDREGTTTEVIDYGNNQQSLDDN